MFRLILAAIAIAAGAPTLAADVPATGANVRAATYGQGTYRQTGPRTWGEFDAAGKQTNGFVEEARDEWSVFLFDPARNVRVQIDLYRKKIRYAENGGSYADLYDVTGATAGAVAAVKPSAPPSPASFQSSSGFWNNSPVRYGVGAAGGNGAGTFRGVEGGAIASQGDADRRCPEAATAVNGQWTGQWRQGQGAYPGLCLVRFEH
ncbi:MAG: hypothetical protein ACTHJR_08065 [Sphingomonas sp.]|uniref:hypothetical protein n=1 Tax=Sphingomonas sp. TaxID=28214 RepID=UPI003F7FF135